MFEWIKPEDKLPEDGQEVLITTEVDTFLRKSISLVRQVEDAVFFYDPDEDEFPFFSVWGDEDTKLTVEVLAWMPKPAPYDGKPGLINSFSREDYTKYMEWLRWRAERNE